MKLDELKKIYFVGIGGIGMSALARYFNGLGIEIFGYDRVETVLTQQLEKEGMCIHYEDDITQIPDGIDLVVYTPAIPDTHQELSYFRSKNYPLKKRAEVLGIISKNRKTIGVAGTHGKTTTSTILTHLLRSSGVDCTAFLGGIAENFQSNFVAGNSEWVVMEADEFDRSFLHLHPEIAVVSSMDADHLDIYGDKASMHQTFMDYVAQVNHTLYYKDGLPLSTIQGGEALEKNTYGIEQGGIQASNLRAEAPYFVFDWNGGTTELKDLKFTLPGEHNILNASVAIAIAKQLGCDNEDIRAALASFKGIKRRFEFVYQTEEQIYIDDYAHHPEELKAAIAAARALYPNKKITAVFQPHLYSRTQDFVEGFASALDALDQVFLLDIYPARELPIEGVSSQLILDKMQNAKKKLVTKERLLECLRDESIEVLMTLGAGDIGVLVPDIAKILAQN